MVRELSIVALLLILTVVPEARNSSVLLAYSETLFSPVLNIPVSPFVSPETRLECVAVSVYAARAGSAAFGPNATIHQYTVSPNRSAARKLVGVPDQ